MGRGTRSGGRRGTPGGPPRPWPRPRAAGDLVLVGAAAAAPTRSRSPAALAFEAPRAGLRAGGVTVDHGLQDGSAERADGVAAPCAGLGLDPVEVRPVDRGPPTGGPEAAARDARYAALDERGRSATGAAAVLLGHTLDDQAETVLLGLARGSGARSLAGMPAVAGRYRRPLLRARPATVTRRGLPRLGLDRVGRPAQRTTPPTPGSGSATDVLPGTGEGASGPGVAAALARTGRTAPGRRRRPRRAGPRERRRDAGGDPMAALDVRRAGRAAAPRSVARVLRRAAIAAGCPPATLAAVHVEAVDAPGHRLARAGRRATCPGRPGAATVWQAALRPSECCHPGDVPAGDRDWRRRGRRDGRTSGGRDGHGADLEKVLITEAEIAGQARRARRARSTADYAGRDLLLVGVLKGAVMVMADLARALHLAGRDGLDGGVVLRLGHQVLGRRAHPQGPRPRHHAAATC